MFICAGDIASNPDAITETFRHLRASYDAVSMLPLYFIISDACCLDGLAQVCYVPGNHDLWTSGDAGDSILKLKAIISSLKVIGGIYAGPVRFLNMDKRECLLTVIPLYSWYHASWDTEPDLDDSDFCKFEEVYILILLKKSYIYKSIVHFQKMPFSLRWADFFRCHWPSDLVHRAEFISTSSRDQTLADQFAMINNFFLSSDFIVDDIRRGTVITFSHFVPRIELVPEKRFLIDPNLMKVIGSEPLERQIRQVKPDIHLVK